MKSKAGCVNDGWALQHSSLASGCGEKHHGLGGI